MVVVEGHLTAVGRRFGIVASRTNDIVTGRLLDGALDALKRLGAKDEDIVVVRTPGAWEVPFMLREVARAGSFDALIALGAVLRGGTPHFEYVSAEVSKGVFQVGMEIDLPVTFGLLTCDNLEQALERSGAKGGNKGFEAAMAAAEMADLRARLQAEIRPGRS
jgi:6,7-dimethyl-8-ribityllumazine synthase